MHEHAGPIQAEVDELQAEAAGLAGRIWDRDHTVWQPDPTEVANRLGWLDSPTTWAAKADEYAAMADELVADGFTDVLLVGMGGSSLYPYVLASLFEATKLRLHVLDTTHPDAVARMRDEFEPATWLLVPASKSGTTLETRCHLATFHADLVAALGEQEAGRHVVAVTDPGSELVALGEEQGFRAVVLNDPDIGGRFSALSAFGMFPAALLGVDVAAHLDAADEVIAASQDDDLANNGPARLGVMMAAAARSGRHHLTVLFEPEVAVFGTWIEQLVAESTGKRGTGLLPIVNETGTEFAHQPGRIVVAVGEHPGVEDLGADGVPVVVLDGFRPDQLAAEVFRWEFATAVAGALMGINAFDQPNVAAAKEATSEVLAGGEVEFEATAADDLLGHLEPGSYLALLAYVDPEGDSADRLPELATGLRDRLNVPVTVGLGPRYLHSTGQLHKGGPDGGVFAVIVEASSRDVAIPGHDFGFARLVAAQAAGDVNALRAAGRPVGVVTIDDLDG